MGDFIKKVEVRGWIFPLAGGLLGVSFGFVSGPLALIAWMVVENYLHGTTFLGLELLMAPVLGVTFGLLQGTCYGMLWAWKRRRPRRLTIAGLMLVVAISGPTLAFVVAFPEPAVIGLFNALSLLPLALALFLVIEMSRKESIKLHRSKIANPAPVPVHDADGRAIEFSEWLRRYRDGMPV